MNLSKIIDILENWAPLSHAEDFDNVGLLVGDVNSKIDKALITLDTTNEVIEEAIEKKCNLVITFHPLIFEPLKSINNENRIQKIIIKAIKNNINIYCIHTNLDNNSRGVNYKICQKLKIKNLNFLIPNKLNESIGMGMYGNIENSYNGHDFINYIKKQMDIKYIRHSKILNKKIKKVAVLGGSGSFGINNAIEKKIDCYITSDLKYHDFFKANSKILLLDIGHYESEKFTKELIYNYLLKKIPKFACIIANTNTNPVNYY